MTPRAPTNPTSGPVDSATGAIGATDLATRPGRLAIVVPCYNEEAVLGETAQRLAALVGRLIDAGRIEADSQIVFVDDGSRDRTWSIIEQLSAADRMFAGIRLSINRGHQNALLAGLSTVDADTIVSIDADLQDDVSVIESMIEQYRSGVDIVYGVRARRDTDTAFKSATARLYYRTLALLGVDIVYNHADYRLMSRRALNALKEYSEVNLFLRGIIPSLGFRTGTVYYDRQERFAGESKYPLRKMLGLAVDGVTSFSAIPLRLIAVLGMLVCLLSFGMAGWVLYIRLFTGHAVPGWASSVIPIYFIGGVQLFCTGIVGEYVAKIYMETKRRPRFVIESRLNV